jgi:hypothetical protein
MLFIPNSWLKNLGAVYTCTNMVHVCVLHIADIDLTRLSVACLCKVKMSPTTLATLHTALVGKYMQRELNRVL